MFEYNGDEGRLASWLWRQNRADGEGMFPPQKGWSCWLSLAMLPPVGKSALQWDFSTPAGEAVRFLVLQLLPDDTLDLRDWGKKSLAEGVSQALVLGSEKQGADLFALCQRAGLPLMVIRQNSAAMLLGEWKNKRIEYRMLQQKLDPESIPRRLPPLPHRYAGGQEAIPFFQSLLHQLNLALAKEEVQLPLSQAIQAAGPYSAILAKKERKELLHLAQAVLQEMENLFFTPFWALKEEKKKQESRPQIFLVLKVNREDKKALSAFCKAQSEALRWLRHQQGQMCLEDSQPPSLAVDQ